MNKIQNEVKNFTDTTKQAFLNTERLIQIFSLFALVAFTGWQIAVSQYDWRLEAILTFCGGVVLLRAIAEYLKYMGKK